MSEKWCALRRMVSLAVIGLAIAGLIYLLLPKTIKSTVTFVFAFLAAFAGCLWFDERVRRRRDDENIVKMLSDQVSQTAEIFISHSDMDHSNGLFRLGEGKMEPPLIGKAPHHGRGPAKRADVWGDLPRLWELFSFILPPSVHKDAFEPAFNNLKKKYFLARKYRSKGSRCWIAAAFTVLSLLMILDCFRVMLQSGAGRIALNFLPDSWRFWWRRQ